MSGTRYDVHCVVLNIVKKIKILDYRTESKWIKKQYLNFVLICGRVNKLLEVKSVNFEKNDRQMQGSTKWEIFIANFWFMILFLVFK